jgi:dihydropteroate synthase
MIWQLRDQTFDLGTTALVMGVLNVTPDSFSDGGQFSDSEAAIAGGLKLIEEGADLIDIGGESSRPRAVSVTLEEELRRVLPVVEGLAGRTTVPLSVDTTKAEVARQALGAGARIINDITALRGDPEMAEVIRSSRAGVILMHMQGEPASMQTNPTYGDVVAEVRDFLEERLRAAADLGIAEAQVVLDPGIGFGKTAEHNWQLLAGLEHLAKLGRPLCLGVSRKRFLGDLLHRPVEQRLAGSLAVVCHVLGRQVVQILRVHDVAATRDAVAVYRQIQSLRTRNGEGEH